MRKTRPSFRLDTGFIAGYVLFGIALVSVVTGSLAFMYRQKSDNTLFEQHRSQLIADATLIRSVIRFCARTYPGGLNDDPNSGYPEFPATGNGRVSTLRCPGAANAGDGSAPPLIWELGSSRSVTGKAPPQRRGLTEWKYINQKQVDGASRLLIYVDALSAEDSLGNRLIDSVSNNFTVKPYFDSVAAVNENGQTVRRLESKNLSE